MSKKIKIILIIASILAIFILLTLLNRSRNSSGINCETQQVHYGSILSRVSGTGELRATAQVNLQAQVMGVVRRLRVQEGQTVRRGDTLLELDRQSYEAQLILARAQFNQTRLRHSRMESLYARNLISAEAYEESRTAYEVAEAQFRQAQDQFNKTVICAPIDGTVTRLNIKEGETVIIGTMNAAGTVLMVIADLSRMEALIQIDETDVLSVQPGQVATVKVDALPDTSFSGRVTRVGYMPVTSMLGTEQTAVNFEVEISLDSTVSALRPGMTVHADIITAQLDSVLVVPIQAVGRRKVKGKDTETVFVVKNNRAVLTPVRTGRSSDTEIEITEGLSPGDEVITGPYKVLSKLTDNALVQAKPGSE
jgi:HlyD family secretion protein|uniref:Efflux RND transporter periplasmic adaptor subunit n=1 Tax=candidate division WOR-3 bacterium TaxID=2052148 RepID=A0A7V3PTV5_UNCW3